MAVGIGVADLLVLVVGPGVVPLAVVVLLAMGAAVFLGTGQIMVNQAAVSAVLVATIQPATGGFSGARFVDALVGAGVALLTNSLILPADPVKMVKAAAEPVLDELAATLEAIAGAIESRDMEAAEGVLLRARDLDELEAALEQAIAVSAETARFAPARRRARGTVDFYADASAQIDLAIRNVRVLARGVVRAGAAGREPPAAGRRRRPRPRRGRAGAARGARGPRPRRRGAHAGAPRRRDRHPRARADRQPVGHRSSSARRARRPSTCCAAPG